MVQEIWAEEVQANNRRQNRAGDLHTGDTVEDAVRNWNQCSSRQLFMAHTVLFVIGETVARKDRLGDRFRHRNRDIPERALVVVCEGTARDALQAQPEFEPCSPQRSIIY